MELLLIVLIAGNSVLAAALIYKLKTLPKSVDESKFREQGFVIDTSAFIDGRFLSAYLDGGLMGKLVVPSSVLAELKTFADSNSSQYAYQKQQALKSLQLLSKHSKSVRYDKAEATIDADEQCLDVAQHLRIPVVTLDAAMSESAKVRGLDVFDVSSLSKELLPVFAKNDLVHVRFISKSKDKPKRALAMSDQGHRCFVENGTKYIGSTHLVKIKTHRPGSQGGEYVAMVVPESNK